MLPPPHSTIDIKLGFNLPWLGYGHDFGRNAWAHDGFSATTGVTAGDADPHGLSVAVQGNAGATLLDQALAEAQHAARGAFQLLRVFVFCDGRCSPCFEADGTVAGLSEEFFSDFDELLRSAGGHGLRVIPVLLDFHWCKRARVEQGVQLGGHRGVLVDRAQRQSFLDAALKPLLTRYGKSPAVEAWEIMNEPEWISEGIPGRGGAGEDIEAVPLPAMREFIGICAGEIHQRTGHKATVGSAQRRWVRLWQGLDLDVYQFHWYDAAARGENRFPWLPAEDLKLDRPCWIGEVPTSNTLVQSGEFLDAAVAGGYEALLFWSLRGADRCSALKTALAGWEPFRAKQA